MEDLTVKFIGDDFESAHKFVSEQSDLVPEKLYHVAVLALVSLLPDSRNRDSVRKMIEAHLDDAINRAFTELSGDGTKS